MIEEQKLRELYHEKEMTQAEIAEQENVTPETVGNWMKKCGIETRSKREATLKQYDPPELYLVNGYEAFAGDNKKVYHHRLLAVAEYGYNAVINNDVHHKNEIPWDNRPDNIDVLSRASHAKVHSKIKLTDNLLMNELYHNEEKTQRKIAEVFGISQASVCRRV